MHKPSIGTEGTQATSAAVSKRTSFKNIHLPNFSEDIVQSRKFNINMPSEETERVELNQDHQPYSERLDKPDANNNNPGHNELVQHVN